MEAIQWLGWPVAAIFIALIFRSSISAALARLRHLKWLGVEATFEHPNSMARHRVPQRINASSYSSLSLAAAWHDIGKCSDQFQQILRRA